MVSTWLDRFVPVGLVLLLSLASNLSDSTAASPDQKGPDRQGVIFARVDGQPLKLDFYRAKQIDGPAPLIVWVHGGAWRRGSRSSVPVADLAQRGFSIASVDYRLSTDAAFPAQIHDIKGAIRFLRARAEELQVDPERFVVAGSSAGGHLAALVGVSGGVPELEGAVGGNGGQSSAVQAVVSYYGASNLETILDQSTPHGLSVRVPALQLLLRAQPDQDAELARLASPVQHVDPGDPPLLLIHGDQDPQMPINQSHELCGAYKEAAAEVRFHVVHGGAHGGQAFYEPPMLDRVAEFLRATLRSGDVDR